MAPANSKSCVQGMHSVADHPASKADDVKNDESPDLRLQAGPAKTCAPQAKRKVLLFLKELFVLVLAVYVAYMKQRLDVVQLELEAIRQDLPEMTSDLRIDPELRSQGGHAFGVEELELESVQEEVLPEKTETVGTAPGTLPNLEEEQSTGLEPSPKLTEELKTDSVPRRKGRLLTSMGTIAAYGAQTRVAGCVTIDMATRAADLTLTVSGDSCNSLRCPTCFIISDAHATAKVIIAAASTMKMSTGGQAMGGSGQYAAMMTSILLVNADTSVVQHFKDGHSTPTTHVLAPASHLMCYAYTGASNALYCPSGFFNNAITLGGAVSVKAGSSFNVDLSATSGTFKTPTGAVTIGTGAVGVSGAATMSATTTFSSHVAASGTSNMDFSGSGGTFKTATGAVTIGDGAVGVTGAATMAATTTFSSNVAASGSALIDFSGTTGRCSVANPWIVR